jgi:hypothetical protein
MSPIPPRPFLERARINVSNATFRFSLPPPSPVRFEGTKQKAPLFPFPCDTSLRKDGAFDELEAHPICLVYQTKAPNDSHHPFTLSWTSDSQPIPDLTPSLFEFDERLVFERLVLNICHAAEHALPDPRPFLFHESHATIAIWPDLILIPKDRRAALKKNVCGTTIIVVKHNLSTMRPRNTRSPGVDIHRHGPLRHGCAAPWATRKLLRCSGRNRIGCNVLNAVTAP